MNITYDTEPIVTRLADGTLIIVGSGTDLDGADAVTLDIGPVMVTLTAADAALLGCALTAAGSS